MEISTITTYLFFTTAVRSSKYQSRAEIISCTPYYDTPGKQYSKQSMKIRTITTDFIFKMAVHSSKYVTMAEIFSCTTDCSTPGEQ